MIFCQFSTFESSFYQIETYFLSIEMFVFQSTTRKSSNLKPALSHLEPFVEKIQKNCDFFASLITQFLPDFCKTHFFRAKFLQDSKISCKCVASIMYLLEDFCNNIAFLAKVLQDLSVSCKVLARYLQEYCIIL